MMGKDECIGVHGHGGGEKTIQKDPEMG